MTDLSSLSIDKLTKAELRARLEELQNGVVEAVHHYPDGCDEGRIEFLRTCGIPDEVIGKVYNIEEAPRSVMLNVTVDLMFGATPSQVVTDIVECLDAIHSDAVDTDSAYVTGFVGFGASESSLTLSQREIERIGSWAGTSSSWSDFENLD